MPCSKPPLQIKSGGIAFDGQLFEPADGTLLDGISGFLEMWAFWGAGGDVGEGVEEGEGVGAEFCAVTAQAMREVGGEGMEAFFS